MLATQRTCFVVFTIFVFIATFTYMAGYHETLLIETPYRTSTLTDRERLAQIFQSVTHDPAARSYVDPAGKHYEGGHPIWKKPLGRKILIVDIDTRAPTEKNNIFNPERMNWEALKKGGTDLVSTGILNHYLYAAIHGPHVIRELLPKYQFVVHMDADAMVSHLDLPLEWMFNRWGIQKETSMALPWDTEEIRNGSSISTDSMGLRVLNGGFIVAQNSTTTLEMLEAWRDCTTETRYKGCANWKTQWSHEQRAFSEYVRYDFNKTPETIVGIPCDDAMGFPGFREFVLNSPTVNEDISDCNGNMIQHYTSGKALAKGAGGVSAMQILSAVLQQQLLGHKRVLWYSEPWPNPPPPKILQPAVEEDEKEEPPKLSGLLIEE
ncbi:hypothetical protein BM1_05126 [Bipolaris maydis]|nr:hypothetical protein BM1_05126 [Bipolaris maydis]